MPRGKKRSMDMTPAEDERQTSKRLRNNFSRYGGRSFYWFCLSLINTCILFMRIFVCRFYFVLQAAVLQWVQHKFVFGIGCKHELARRVTSRSTSHYMYRKPNWHCNSDCLYAYYIGKLSISTHSSSTIDLFFHYSNDKHLKSLHYGSCGSF